VYKTPISVITRAKWTGAVTQVVEHLLCNHEALSSNPSPITTKNIAEKGLQFLVGEKARSFRKAAGYFDTVIQNALEEM
jgi:hypothetical protein